MKLKNNNQLGGMKDEEITLENGKTITISFPESVFCPITLSLMEDPVIATDGFTYERTAIQRVLDDPNPRTSRVSPQTREKLKKSLIPNKNLIQIMNELKQDAYNKQLDREIGHLVKLASENNPQAIFELSLKYRTGEKTLVVKDIVKSIQLLKKSYKLKHGPAKILCENTKYIKEKYFDKGIDLYKEGKYSIAANIWEELLSLKFHDAYAYLADLLIDGRFGVPKNYERAFQLTTEGVALGSKNCLGVLGRCYVFGIGVSKDEKKGICLAKEGAEINSFFSQYVIGMCYYEGIVLLNDFNQAKINFTLAANQEYANAQYMLAVLQNNFLINCDPNIDYQISDYKEYYYELAAKQGLDKAQFELGDFLLSEIRDREKAEKYLNLAAEQGSGNAYWLLYQYYIEINKEDKKDFYFNKALEKGILAAQEILAQKYYQEGKYKESFELLKLIVEKDYKGPIFGVIGNMYENGLGVDKNYSNALCWYHLAIEKGEYHIYIDLSKMYENGYGVDVDYEKVTKYLYQYYKHNAYLNIRDDYFAYSFNKLHELAETGIVSAKYFLGKIYEKGIGIESDYRTSLNFFQEAADENYIKAIYKLGKIHDNREYALECIQKAVDMGYAKAQYYLGYEYLYGNDLINIDEEKGLELFKLSANQGYAKAQFKLAMILLEREEKDKKKIIINLLRLSASRDKENQFYVGIMYLTGDKFLNITIDYKEAIRYFHLSAEQGHANAQIYLARTYEITQNYTDILKYYYLIISKNENYAYLILYKLARLYEEGKVFKKDYTEALRLYTASNNLYKKDRPFVNGFEFSAAKLGIFYEKGLGCEINYEKAVHFYNIISNTYINVPDAFINYAKMLEEGRGVEKNIKEAYRLFYKAAACGNKEALDRYKKKAESGKLQDIYNLATLYEQNDLLNEATALYCFLSEKGFKRGLESKLKGYNEYKGYENIDQYFRSIT